MNEEEEECCWHVKKKKIDGRLQEVEEGGL